MGALARYRARELQMEALHSEKLKEYFEDHPDDKKALQSMQRKLREGKSVRRNLAHIPSYLVPEHFLTSTPVQKAIREDAAAHGTTATQVVRRTRRMQERQADPLQGFKATTKKGMRKLRFSKEAMIAKDRRIQARGGANVEDLPPLSGRKLWKLRHRKSVRRPVDTLGERRFLSESQKKRKKKFPV